MSVLLVPNGRRRFTFNQDVIDAIYQVMIPLSRGEEGGLSILGHLSSRPVNRIQEQQGYKQTTRVDLQYPDGAGLKAMRELMRLGKKLGFLVERVRPGYRPEIVEP